MIRILWFAIVLSACAVDPDLRDIDPRINSREGSFISVSACSSCHSSFTLPFDDGLLAAPQPRPPHTACATDAACAEAHAEAPAAALSNAFDSPCETCHAFVTR
jgi:hypothetical protein